MNKAVVVQPSGKWEILEFSEDNCLAVFQKAVDGLIQDAYIRPNLTMTFNEEYLFKGFDENFMASAIYEDAFGVERNPILGPVVYTGGVDKKGYTLGLDEKHLNAVIEMAEVQKKALEGLYE